jgi:hypothetical protein
MSSRVFGLGKLCRGIATAATKGPEETVIKHPNGSTYTVKVLSQEAYHELVNKNRADALKAALEKPAATSSIELQGRASTITQEPE